ncbi:MAG: ABC transporter permease [Bacilli bacterium]|nr:ABC transporter permease [Bacilli bacterium]
MIVFKNYFKILNKHKGVILLYVGILLLFTLFSTQSNNNTQSFVASKPNVAVINNDSKTEIVNNLYRYLEENTDIIDIENNDSKLNDALFYQEIDAIIYIYDGYTNDYLSNKENNLNVKYGNTVYSSYVDMILKRYFKIADIVNDDVNSTDDIISIINNSLKNTTEVEIKNTLDVDTISKASYFFNYANYSILAICIYSTAIILIRFNNKKIKNRNNISSKKSSSITKELYLGNLVFVLFVWLFVVALSIFINKDIMFTINGMLLIVNSLVFMICALSVGFLIGIFFNNESAIAAAVNIIALGTSFICGSFIPVEYLPNTVVAISKVLPSYWFIQNNNLIKTIEVFNYNTIIPLIINMFIIIIFAFSFFMMAVIYNKKRIKN